MPWDYSDTTRSRITFTCDRCGDSIETTGHWPSGWDHVYDHARRDNTAGHAVVLTCPACLARGNVEVIDLTPAEEAEARG